MKKISCFLNCLVFLITTVAIGCLIYEGYALEWFNIVGLFILLMDGSFMAATLVNLWVEKRSKWLFVHVFSLVLILTAIVMKVMTIEYPTITLVLWCLYIWFVYGISIVRWYTNNRRG